MKLALPTCPTLKEIRYWYSTMTTDSLDALMQIAADDFKNVDTSAEDVALIAFTSGTTGKPKGTMHFHRDVIAMCDCFPRSCLKPAQDDIFIGSPPLAFTFGLGGLLCFPLRFGASTALVEKFTPETLLESIQKFRATILLHRADHVPRAGRPLAELRPVVAEEMRLGGRGAARRDAPALQARRAASRSSTASARPR